MNESGSEKKDKKNNPPPLDLLHSSFKGIESTESKGVQSQDLPVVFTFGASGSKNLEHRETSVPGYRGIEAPPGIHSHFWESKHGKNQTGKTGRIPRLRPCGSGELKASSSSSSWSARLESESDWMLRVSRGCGMVPDCCPSFQTQRAREPESSGEIM